MADNSAIEWTNSTWNPITGCTKVSAGCDNCYAERMAERFRGVPGNYFEAGFDLTLRPSMLSRPMSWKRPRMIFVNSMSDLFHKDVPATYISSIFDVMERADWHTYQVLTKRSSLMRKFVNARYGASPAPANIWLGVSVEDAAASVRIDHLRLTRAAVRFLSIEPLLGPVGRIDLSGISWVICGGESGPRARQMRPEWAREVRDQCVADGIPFFFKQWGGRTPKAGGKVIDGREWCEFPRQPTRGSWNVTVSV